MIVLEKTQVSGLEAAIRGMRNPMNSWAKSDSGTCGGMDDGFAELLQDDFRVGEADLKLMMDLAEGGPVHAKYRRMIIVTVDMTAPLYWWKEFDTYKVGTVANSCSTMHKIHAKAFTPEDFSHEHLTAASVESLKRTISDLNACREEYLSRRPDENGAGSRKEAWWQMIQLLPSSYNQKRTVLMNYEVLAGIYPSRKSHKLDEWRDFCRWIEGLPYSEVIIGGEAKTLHADPPRKDF